MNLDEPTKKIVQKAMDKCLIPQSEEDIAWCVENLHPHLEDLEGVVKMARWEVDRKLTKELERHPEYGEKHSPGYRHPARYPTGFCGPISEGIYLRLKRLSKTDDSPSLVAIKKLD